MIHSDTYSTFLVELKEGNITHSEFLEYTNNDEAYKSWCREHQLKPTEDNAELYFDMHGFEETEVVKEYIEGMAS